MIYAKSDPQETLKEHTDELVNQINPKYNWHDIQKSIRNLCKNNDERALLLGFNSLESAKNITSSIKDKKA